MTAQDLGRQSDPIDLGQNDVDEAQRGSMGLEEPQRLFAGFRFPHNFIAGLDEPKSEHSAADRGIVHDDRGGRAGFFPVGAAASRAGWPLAHLSLQTKIY